MDLTHYEFYPQIDVYPNVFKDVKETMRIIKNAEGKTEKETLMSNWHDWYTFGYMLGTIRGELKDGKYVIVKQEDGRTEPNEWEKAELAVYQEFHDIFHAVVQDYIKRHGHQEFVDANSWAAQGPSLCKYMPDAGAAVEEDLAMNYHTDYQNELHTAPGWKFGFTVTMYLNDDYDDGGVDFYVNNELAYYKPKAGEVMVFPAGSPHIEKDNLYLHGVKVIKGGEKYFVRMNYQYFSEGSKEWREGFEKYGEETWLAMEKEKHNEIRANFQNEHRPKKDAVRVI